MTEPNDSKPQPPLARGQDSSVISISGPKLLYCVTVPMSAATLLRGQMAYFVERGWAVHLACAPGAELSAVAAREGVVVHEIPMCREVSVLRDMRSLCAMLSLIRSIQPDVVNAGTPKAGLIGMISAYLLRVKGRVYVMRGLRLEGAKGIKRAVLAMTERISCSCASVVICVSHSLRSEAVASGVVAERKAHVIGAGSSNGVDCARFTVDTCTSDLVQSMRTELDLPEGTPTVGFVGRLTRDKGAVELLEAFDHLYSEDHSRRLLIVGEVERQDALPSQTMRMLQRHEGIIRVGLVDETAPYYQLMCVLCLPTHREGFPNAPLEAAASGIPTVTTTATGARDAVVDGETGLVVSPGDSEELTVALRLMLENPDRARSMGESARRRVVEEFAQARIWTGLEAIYREVLEA